MTLIINRTPLLYYVKRCALFQTISEFKQELRSGNAQFGSGKIGYFLSRVTLKFDGWHWKTIGHLSYATSSFVHHFVAICEFKLELRPESAVDTKLLPEPVVTYHPAVGFCDNLLGAASWELCKIIIRKMSLKLIVLESFPHSSGTNELRKSTCTSSRNLIFSSIDPTKVHYGGVIMSTIASQITSLTIVY